MPEDGNLVILFSPHVGIAPDGTFGKFARQGQGDYCDNSCGAAVNAYRWLETNEWEAKTVKHIDAISMPPDTSPFDYQSVYIREALKPYFDEIEASEEPMAELAYAMYEITHQFIGGIVEPIPNVKVSLIGGIQVNVQQPCGDLFVPLMFDVIMKGKKTKDLYHVFSDVQTYQ
jgi:hypothetical protein